MPRPPKTTTPRPPKDFPPITISNDMVDALSRLSQAEVGNQRDRAQHVGYVTDSVINRVQSTKGIRYPSTISGVINQPAQYSSVSNSPNKVGDWRLLPAAEPAVVDAVKRRLGEIYATGATSPYMQFLNPRESDGSSMTAWGKALVADPKSLHLGDHYYGMTPWQRLPERIDIDIPPGTLYPGKAVDSGDRYAERQRQIDERELLRPLPYEPAQKEAVGSYIAGPTALPRVFVSKADEDALREALWGGWHGIDQAASQTDNGLYGWDVPLGALAGARR